MRCAMPKLACLKLRMTQCKERHQCLCGDFRRVSTQQIAVLWVQQEAILGATPVQVLWRWSRRDALAAIFAASRAFAAGPENAIPIAISRTHDQCGRVCDRMRIAAARFMPALMAFSARPVFLGVLLSVPVACTGRRRRPPWSIPWITASTLLVCSRSRCRRWS